MGHALAAYWMSPPVLFTTLCIREMISTQLCTKPLQNIRQQLLLLWRQLHVYCLPVADSKTVMFYCKLTQGRLAPACVPPYLARFCLT